MVSGKKKKPFRKINKAVKQFVDPHQNGFVPNGFIAENTMLLNMLKAQVEDEDSDAIFLFLDMEKAFDRCSWDFLMRAMRRIGYTDGFINYIKLVYSHERAPKRKLYVNGYLGPEFELGSGVAQGCPCHGPRDPRQGGGGAVSDRS